MAIRYKCPCNVYILVYSITALVQDAPVESARIFHERMQRTLNDWIYINKGKDKGVIGRVKDYLIRYEVQDRG